MPSRPPSIDISPRVFCRVVLIGSDNPTLPFEPIRQACAALGDHDLSIGPTVDGGYYLIGMRAAHLGVFLHDRLEHAAVYAQTLARAQHLGLRTHAVRECTTSTNRQTWSACAAISSACTRRSRPNTRAALERLSLVRASRQPLAVRAVIRPAVRGR